MIITEKNTVINDVHRKVLIITSPTPIPDFANNVIADTAAHYETVYYTEGVFRSFEDGGNFINWYLVRSKEVRERLAAQLAEENAALKTTMAQIVAAFGGIAENEFNKAMEVIENV